MVYSSLDLLEERERRVEVQNELMEKYQKTLLCIRVNYPGIYKDTDLSRKIFFQMEKIVVDLLSIYIEYKLLKVTAEGPIEIMILNEEPDTVKSMAMRIEDTHPLGRFVDIDVYDPQTKVSISRTKFKAEPRRCYLCNDLAVNCTRQRKHQINELINYMGEKYKEYVKNIYEGRI